MDMKKQIRTYEIRAIRDHGVYKVGELIRKIRTDDIVGRFDWYFCKAVEVPA